VSAIRILLVDDHELFRASLRRLLADQKDLEVVGDCATVSAGLDLLAPVNPTLVLLDYDLGEEQGPTFLREAHRRGFKGRVLMLTAGMSDGETLQAMEAGAAGIFLKHSPADTLVEAIRKVSAGEVWLDSGAVRPLVAGATRRTSAPSDADFTARERDVLKGVFEGLSNKEIGVHLGVSEGTVKAVMQQLFDKTGVRTRSQLVRIALERQRY
jgi:DNA-binding NarL/FixJ family response regulator